MIKRGLSCIALTLIIMFPALIYDIFPIALEGGLEQEMYRGINLGNALEASKEGEWG